MKSLIWRCYLLVLCTACLVSTANAELRSGLTPRIGASPGEFNEMLRKEAMKDSLTRFSAERPVQDAMTHADLDGKYRDELALGRSQQVQPVEGLVDPAKAAAPADLLSTSDILCFRGVATLVPKRAVLQVPDRFRDRLGMKEGCQIKAWPEFYAFNRDWIRPVEVTRAQAEGVAPFTKETAKVLETSQIVVIATLKGGPISVLPSAEPSAQIPTKNAFK